MSGGSWDYVYSRIDEAADRLIHSNVPERIALGRKLKPFAHALYAIEWVDSSDWGDGDEAKPIRDALGADADALILSVVLAQLTAKVAEAQALLAAPKEGE